jgi:hypothetical protein
MSQSITSYQELLPIERQLLIGKLVDIIIYDPAFCTEMIKVVKLKEEAGEIRSKFMADLLQ